MAPVNHAPVANGDILPDVGLTSVIHMDNGAILNVGTITDGDRGNVAPQHRFKPDADLFAQGHTTDQRRRVGNKNTVGDDQGVGYGVQCVVLSGSGKACASVQISHFFFQTDIARLPDPAFHEPGQGTDVGGSRGAGVNHEIRMAGIHAGAPHLQRLGAGLLQHIAGGRAAVAGYCRFQVFEITACAGNTGPWMFPVTQRVDFFHAGVDVAFPARL